jgi:hypothetical protein
VSDETYANLQEAISQHVLDEYGEQPSLVKDWVLVAGLTDVESVDGLEKIVLHRSEGTSLYAVTGLLTWGADTMDSVGYINPEDY